MKAFLLLLRIGEVIFNAGSLVVYMPSSTSLLYIPDVNVSRRYMPALN